MIALHTPWSRSIGLTSPIVSAPMGGAAGGVLAAAVSRAGGLGMIGMGSTGSTERPRTELSMVDAQHRPWGIGLVDWRMRQDTDLLPTALAAHPTLLCAVLYRVDVPVLAAGGIASARGVAAALAAGAAGVWVGSARPAAEVVADVTTGASDLLARWSR